MKNTSKETDFYVNNANDLAEIIAKIKQEKLVALDTEFTRRTTYYPIVSIIQGAIKVGPNKQKFIIDCQLADFDLSGFFELICDKKVKKILHSSLQDLQIFHRAHNKRPQSIIDTQIMSNFCDFGFNVGYSSLVEKVASQTISKAQQNSNWQKRPLSKKQIEYALLDVEFLHEIYEKFSQILQEKNRQDWCQSELEIFTDKAITSSPEALMKKFSFRRKNPDQIAKMQNLIMWREKTAQKHDVIRQYFLKDEEIENIILRGELLPKKHPKLKAPMFDEITQILQDDQKPLLKIENKLLLSDEDKKSFDLARDLIVKIANKEKLPAQFLLTSSELKKIINYPHNFSQIVSGWRHDLFGNDLKKLI